MKRITAAIVVVLVLILAAMLIVRLRHRSARPGESQVTSSTHVQPETQQDLVGGPLTLERQRRFATLACGQPLRSGRNGSFGCPICPKTSDFGGNAGPYADSGDKEPAWIYASMIFGHFTSSAYDEALLRTDGCESHANDLGGDFLFRREGTNWTPIRYISGGLASETCQRLRWTGGRDALVCQVGDMHQGVAEDTVLLLTIEPTEVAGRPEGQDSQFLYATTDDSDCERGQGVRVVKAESVDKVNLLPPGPDGRQDIEILVSAGTLKAKVSDDACPEPPKKPYRLLFRNAGDHFVAGPGVAEWRALNADNEISHDVRPILY